VPSTALLEELLPLEKFVREEKMRLDDDIESPRSDEAVGSRHGEVEGSHDFCDADGGTARNTDSAVNKSRGIPLPPAIL
jgi:hypothetical protein